MTIEDPPACFPPPQPDMFTLKGVRRHSPGDLSHTIFSGAAFAFLSSRIYELAERRTFPQSALISTQHDEKAIFQHNLMRINYHGGPGTITRFLSWTSSKGPTPPFISRKDRSGGNYSHGLVDSVTTPFAEKRLGTSGVEVQANIVNNLLLDEPSM
jgi:hypothetical protein